MITDTLRGLLVYIAVAGALTLLSTTSVLAAGPDGDPTVWIAGLALLSWSVAMPLSLAIRLHLRHRASPRIRRRVTAA